MSENTELLAQHRIVSDFIAEKIQKKSHLLLDGAMGTALFSRGLMSGDSPELWNLEQPEKITDVYRSYLKSGSDIILTNSFGGNQARLKLHHLQQKSNEINRAAADLARQAIAELIAKGEIADKKYLVGGSVGPLGELIAPLGNMERQEAEEIFTQQCQALKAGGADLIWIETMSLLDEVDAAYQGAKRAGIPCAITLSFDMNGKTMMGVSEQEFCDYARALEVKPVAIGFNCGLGFSDSLLTLQGLLDHAGDFPVIAKSNCGLPVFRDDEIHFDGTPELMRDYAIMARNAGAAIIGGCCGSSAHHVQQMADGLDTPKVQKALRREDIEEKFGVARAPNNQSVAQIEQEILRKKRSRRRG